MLIHSPAQMSSGTSGRFLAPHAVAVHVAFQLTYPNESLVSSTATLWSRPAVGRIIMWQADRTDLNLNGIFNHMVHT